MIFPYLCSILYVSHWDDLLPHPSSLWCLSLLWKLSSFWLNVMSWQIESISSLEYIGHFSCGLVAKWLCARGYLLIPWLCRVQLQEKRNNQHPYREPIDSLSVWVFYYDAVRLLFTKMILFLFLFFFQWRSLKKFTKCEMCTSIFVCMLVFRVAKVPI